MGHDARSDRRRSTATSATSTRSSSSMAARRLRTARWRPPPTRAATASRPSGDAHASCAILRAPVTGERSHDVVTGTPRRARATGGARDLERRPELPVHERDRNRSRGDGRPPRVRARGSGRHARRRERRRSTAMSAGGSGSARRRAAPVCSTPRGMRPRSMPSSSCATGRAGRRSCAERPRPHPPRPPARPGPRRPAVDALLVDATGIARLGARLRVRLRALGARGRVLADRGARDERPRVRRGVPVRRRSAMLRAGSRGRAIVAADSAAQRPPPALLRGPRRRGSEASHSLAARSLAHLLTDEAFALSVGHFRRLGRTDEWGYWVGAIVSTFIPWTSATLAGRAARRPDPGPGAVRHRHHLPGRDDRPLGRA